MENTPTLVMVHGLMGSRSFFAPQERMPGLAVRTPALPGYGALAADQRNRPITLEGQADAVVRYLEDTVDGPCWLLGHSVGGAVAMLAAAKAPELVHSVINVEGNFTLNDAFWCGKIAAQPEDEWEADHHRLVADAGAWLQAGGIEPTAEREQWAQEIFDYQGASTIRAVARAVVAATGSSAYLPRLRSVIERGMPVYLLSGERSAAGWDVPAWMREAARASIVQPNTGHLMMLEAPDAFCDIVRSIVMQ
jgi:pimeloyl-ACP methyl ester carboxylesterase